MTAPASTVLVVDDHPIVRRGLATLLGMEPWVARVVEAASVREAHERAVTERPDAAVVDLGLPDGDGFELIGRIRRAVPGCAVVVLTMTREETVVRACMAAGARGYLLKDTAPSVIVNSVRAVLDGVVVLGPEVSSAALHDDEPARLPPPFDRLTPTEVRILGMVALGRSNAQIARELGVAEKTVRNRLTAVLASIGVADRVQAALLAQEKGLHRLAGH